MTTEWYILYPALFITAFFAGLVDSIAGGGGLITVPVMLGLGLPPQVALGTNKLQASFGSFTAAYYYTRHSVVDLKKARTGIFFTLIGSAFGTLLVQLADPDMLRRAIPFILAVILLYIIFKPAVGDQDAVPRLSPLPFFIGFGLALGFYDGFLGPGVGTFWTIALVVLLGQSLLTATGCTKVMNFTSNITSLAVFMIGGNIIYSLGLVMAAGQTLGARAGSKLVIRKGAKLIRPVFITMVTLTLLKLLYDQYLR